MTTDAGGGPAPFEPRHEAAQAGLKRALLADGTGKVLEELSAALFGALLGVPVAVAASGFQHGGDAGPAGRGGRRFRLETKRYADTTSLRERELLGEMDQALVRDPALEAWVLVSTREVSEQITQSLVQKGERDGVPVLVVAWEESGLASLAALCASAPDIVSGILSPEAGDHARALAEVAGPAVEALRRDMASWALGFKGTRTILRNHLAGIWADRRAAQADFDQDAAVGACPGRVRRDRALARFDAWLAGRATTDAPLLVFGLEGVGKTWAVVDWLHGVGSADTIVVPVPSTMAPTGSTGEGAVRELLAQRLRDVTGTRDAAHWRRRVDRLLVRPPGEGPVFTLFLDGLNQAPSAPWLPFLKASQATAFAGRVRVIATTRKYFLDNRLGNLNALVVGPERVEVEAYDLEPGGEFDRRLAAEGLERTDLDADLIGLARIPRMFDLVVRLRDRLAGTGPITPHRVLWEYGRDTLGVRTGGSFSETEWREWLAEVATRWRRGEAPVGTGALGETVARPDVGPDGVQARLSDIIDGRFAADGASGVELSTTTVVHALGAALLDRLASMAGADADALEAELGQWLEPIAGLDLEAEILRAGVSIGIERDPPAGDAVLGVLVTAWLRSQNLEERHLRELARVARELVGPLLDAVERAGRAGRRDARQSAIDALRAIPKDDAGALRLFAERGVRWLRRIGLPSGPRSDPDRVRRDRERLVRFLGTDQGGPLAVLGTELSIGGPGSSAAAALPSLLQGRPLAGLGELFEAAALRHAVSAEGDLRDALAWLCILNEADPAGTRDALRAASESVRRRGTEPGIIPGLPARVAAILLGFAGDEASEREASALDPRLERGLTYETDYLPDPGNSLLPLERRHAGTVMDNPATSFGAKVTKTKELLLDPTFEPPPRFGEECRDALAGVDPNTIGRSMGTSIAEHRLETWTPALARTAPEDLAAFQRRKLTAIRAATAGERRWAAIRAVGQHVLVDDDVARSAAALRAAFREADPLEEAFVSALLLGLELDGRGAFEQARIVIEAGLAYILDDLMAVLEPLGSDDAGRLIDLYGAGTDEQRHNLLVVLSLGDAPLDDHAWTYVRGFTTGSEGDQTGFAHGILARRDTRRRGAELDAEGWSWAPARHPWSNHWGSIALVEATRGSPFADVAPRLAPHVLLRAARVRGADPAEVRLATETLDAVIRTSVAVPDLGAAVAVVPGPDAGGPPDVSITPTETDPVRDGPAARPMDDAAARERSVRIARTARDRISETRAEGAALFLVDMDVDDLREAMRHAPDVVARWMEGWDRDDAEFARRVRLAESTFLALCEALLEADPVGGAGLWRTLRGSLALRHPGPGGVDETIHMLFRVPRSDEVDALLAEARGLAECHTDQHVADLVFAAEWNGRASWADEWRRADAASAHPWRARRALMIAAFTTGADLPVDEAWPAVQHATSFDALRTTAARSRWRDACARHWWRAYLAAPDAAAAFAAWALYSEATDGRDEVWRTGGALDRSAAFPRLKAAHVALNARDLRRKRDKRAEARRSTFLGRRVPDDLAPWSG